MQAPARTSLSRSPDGSGSPFPHRAGQKIRAWRQAQEPRMSAEDFGRRYGVSMPTVYRYEAGTAIASVALALQLEQDGVCSVADWARPAAAAEVAV